MGLQARDAIPTEQEVTAVPHSRLRKKVAKRMADSKATVPHAHAMIDVDYTAVKKLRSELRPQWRTQYGLSLTYIPFAMKAVADALHTFPLVNSVYTDDELIATHRANIGIAVDVAFEGILVPVVHDVRNKTLRDVAGEVATLAERARLGALQAKHVSGGSFTITNPGSTGCTATFPIINKPQVAIMSTDAVIEKPCIRIDGDGAQSVGIAPIGNLTLAWDHRAFDGAYATSFLASVRDSLQSEEWLVALVANSA